MKAHPTVALFRKDFRLNRIPIFGGAVLIFMPYLVGFALFLTHGRSPLGQSGIRSAFMPCPWMALVLTIAIAGVFGGAAFAYERRERWADFLAILPVTRARSLLSKLAVSLLFLLTISAINLLVFYWLLGPNPGNEFLGALMLIAWAGSVAMCFGVAWLISAFQSSPALAACVSIGATLACAIVVSQNSFQSSLMFEDEKTFVIQAGVAGLIGCLSFLFGSIYYLRRIKP
jgi:ABC-type transport system involved in multi-copper enzyme maturation permease subunit